MFWIWCENWAIASSKVMSSRSFFSQTSLLPGAFMCFQQRSLSKDWEKLKSVRAVKKRAFGVFVYIHKYIYIYRGSVPFPQQTLQNDPCNNSTFVAPCWRCFCCGIHAVHQCRVVWISKQCATDIACRNGQTQIHVRANPSLAYIIDLIWDKIIHNLFHPG